MLPDGTVKHIHAIHHPVFSRSGELVEVAGTHVDVTERNAPRLAMLNGDEMMYAASLPKIAILLGRPASLTIARVSATE